MSRLKKKKKFKGTRYVANVLRKYFKKKYPNYTSALPKAREVTAQLKASGQKFTVKNVEFLVRKHRVKPSAPERKAPLLFYKLTNVIPYFELVDYPTYIYDTTDEIYFVSGIFNADVEDVQGGKRPRYSKTFSEFVNFSNKQIDPENYTEEFLVTTLPPEWNNETKRWEARIVTVNSDGNETDYGYEPSAPTSIEDIDKKISPKKIEKKEKKPATKSEQYLEKEIELKISKEKSRQQANEMFLKGLLTKLEYKEEIRRIDNL
jgi:hypothetical protein